MTNKLYRSRHDKMLAGVCAGIAEYFDIDPTLVRLGFAIFVFAYGSGILAYILCELLFRKDPMIISKKNLCMKSMYTNMNIQLKKKLNK